jgi:hypothetical protein
MKLTDWNRMMRHTYAVLVLAIIALPAQGDLVVHHSMDEGGGATIRNTGATGAFNNATIDTANTFVAGKIGSALSFDGTINSTFEAGPTPLLGATPRTVSLWIKTATAKAEESVMSFGLDANGNGGKFDVDIDDATGLVEIGVAGGRTDSSTLSGTPVNDDAWHLIAVVLPAVTLPTLNDAQFYVDGILSHAGGGTTAQEIHTLPGGGLFYGRNPNQDAAQAYTGLLDDPAIWNEVLSSEEMLGLYQVGDQAGINALGFHQLMQVHDAGSGFAVVNNRRWNFAGGLAAAAGLSGTGPSNYTLVLSDAANTGLVSTSTTYSPGDVDLVNGVNAADLLVIRNNFLLDNRTRTQGDLTGDGRVDTFDYELWRASAPPSLQSLTIDNVAIPEPATAVSVAIAAALVVGIRRFARK